MKKSKIKAIFGLAALSLSLLVFTPITSYAQQKQNQKNHKKGKVVTPVKHYKKQPKMGAQVNVLPNKSVIIAYRNNNYHYRNGVFYRPLNGNYIVTVPPIGIRVTTLPPNPYRIMVSGAPYYYYYGSYYADYPQGGYEVVTAPIGAIVDALPDGYEIFELDGKVYYRLNDTYYKAVLEDNGNVVYQVVRV